MRKVRAFICCLFLFILTSLLANPINVKGDFVKFTKSPLVVAIIVQENNNKLQILYTEAKKYYDNEEYSTSLKKSLTLLAIVRKEGDSKLEYLCNYLIGSIFNKINNHDKALAYFKDALKNIEFKNDIVENLTNYDKSFQNSEPYSKALLQIGGEYQRLNKRDSAEYYYLKIIKLNFLDNKNSTIKARAYNNLSGIYLQDSIYEKAKIYALKAIDIYQKKNENVSQAAVLGALASIHLEEKDYVKAKEIYSRALNLIDKDTTNTAILYKEKLYYNLAWTLFLLKDYMAYDYQEKSYEIKDDLRDKEMRRIVEDVYAKYQEEYKVELVRNQVALKKAEEKKTAWFFGVLSLLIIIISGVVIYNYKLRQKNLKLHLDQTKLSQESKLEKLKSDSQVRILNATLDGKEAERKQIAETLHDSVSSLLSSANLHLQASKMQFKEEAPVEIEKTQKIIVEASQTIRDLSHTLVSSVLLKFGLKYAIKDMAEKYSNSKIKIDINIKNVKRYQQNFEIKVNNIIQELVNNILKHSNATKAIVKMIDKDGILFVDIQDNGEGFDKTEIAKKDSLGINQVEARIQMMKGVFRIDSNAETGTKIKIELPILEKEETSRV
jgi:two-component system NarL family sensor kinase